MIRTGILSIPEWDERAIDQLRKLLRARVPGAIVIEEKSAKNQRNWIEEILRIWADEEELDLILTIGGTYPAPGPSNDEIVPEATLSIVERLLPGVSEAMRAVAHEQTELALLDRGVAGIRSRSLLINLPAGTAAAHLFLEAVVDVIPAIVAHLQGEERPPQIEYELELNSNDDLDSHENLSATGDPDALPERNQKAESNPKRTGLNPAEFAEFLRRQKDD